MLLRMMAGLAILSLLAGAWGCATPTGGREASGRAESRASGGSVSGIAAPGSPVWAYDAARSGWASSTADARTGSWTHGVSGGTDVFVVMGDGGQGVPAFAVIDPSTRARRDMSRAEFEVLFAERFGAAPELDGMLR